MEYKIITHWKLADFVVDVNNAIAQGWKPLGGVSTVMENHIHFSQAMVR